MKEQQCAYNHSNYFSVFLGTILLCLEKFQLKNSIKKNIVLIVLLWGGLSYQSKGSEIIQGITLSLKDVSIPTVFKEIEKQSDYRVIYDPQFFAEAEAKTIKVTNVNVSFVLDLCLDRLPLTYTISNAGLNKYIIIKKNIKVTHENSSLFSSMISTNEPIEVSGTVRDELGNPLVGATVTIRGSSLSTLTSSDGKFSFKKIDPKASIIITSVGYEPQIFTLKGKSEINIRMVVNSEQMKEVVVMNTGYQKTPKERATGSFVFIDSSIINRSVGSNIISRLKDITPGVLFDTRDPNNTKIQIRGLYSLDEGMAAPLIVVNNFPFQGTLNDINPNDIENISILRDAAAASIWGAKAGNGVIVITTKDGQFNQPVSVNFNTSFQFASKPRLFKQKIITSSDYLDLQKYLFGQGFYDADITNTFSFPPIDEGVQIFQNEKEGIISKEEADRRIDELRGKDVRSDYLRYIYRQSINQQSSINLNGGGQFYKYFFSIGYDKNITNLIGNSEDRITFNLNNSFKVTDKLIIGVTTSYANTKVEMNSIGDFGSTNEFRMPIYSSLVDKNGKSISFDRIFRKTFIDTFMQGNLLNWKYDPLQELSLNDRMLKTNLFTAALNLRYNINKNIGINAQYMFQKSESRYADNHDVNSFFTRDLINTFTNPNSTIEVDRYPVPIGNILDLREGQMESHNFRSSVSYSKTFLDRHQIDALAGAEARQTRNTSDISRVYGYQEEILNSRKVDYLHLYPTLPFGNEQYIPDNSDMQLNEQRFVALFSNLSYTYDNRYVLSASARKDASNLFGVSTNNKGRPFWSIGAMWKISNEQFFQSNLISTLNFRVTYGFSGNINPNATASPIIEYGTPSSNRPIFIDYAILTKNSNPNLRWEKVGTFNYAIDFSMLKNRINGVVDFYNKNSKDLFGLSKLPASSGFITQVVNSANMKGNGFDFQLNTTNIKSKNFCWYSNFALSKSKYKITKYILPTNGTGYISNGELIAPLVGYSPYLLVSYRSTGSLDPENGDPIGIIDGKPSKDYAAILQTPLEQQKIHGSALPIYFGNFLHRFTWKGISISTNFTFKFDYYFRKPTVNYLGIGGPGVPNSEFLKRWQKPGDELFTSTPSFIYPVTYEREYFYNYSEVNVLKGDHIRLNDIAINYSINKSEHKSGPFKSLDFFANISNLNIVLWRANKENIDPDFPSGNTSQLFFAIGLRGSF